MNCLITAGPTYESLDDVRRLTNFSTGRLGAELADFLAERGHEVTLLRGFQATWQPAAQKGRVETFSTTADLRARLQAHARNGVDAVFHAAAVSDFTFGKIWHRSGAGELTEGELMHTIFPHPTLSEMMHEATLDAYGKVIHT